MQLMSKTKLLRSNGTSCPMWTSMTTPDEASLVDPRFFRRRPPHQFFGVKPEVDLSDGTLDTVAAMADVPRNRMYLQKLIYSFQMS